MKAFKTHSLLFCVFVMTLFVTSCDHDCDPTKEIYGIFTGSAQEKTVALSTGEVTDDNTHSASLVLTKSGKSMSLSVDYGENGHFSINKLPDVDVNGSSNYSYEYTSEDGTVNIKIKSPDFNVVNVSIGVTMHEEGIARYLTFNGKRK